jgi:hypothetical protein
MKPFFSALCGKRALMLVACLFMLSGIVFAQASTTAVYASKPPHLT